MDSTTTYVFIAGIGNSEPEHWQSLWRGRAAKGVWVEHGSWNNPIRDVWVKEFDDTLKSIEGPKILIAHSLGCTLVTEWASEYGDDAIVGSFLVSMPDVHGENFPAQAVGFGAPRPVRLPFRTVVVASEDDPYGSLESSSAGAEKLGARLVNVGRKGHINLNSGLGDWPEGWAIFSTEFAS